MFNCFSISLHEYKPMPQAIFYYACIACFCSVQQNEEIIIYFEIIIFAWQGDLFGLKMVLGKIQYLFLDRKCNSITTIDFIFSHKIIYQATSCQNGSNDLNSSELILKFNSKQRVKHAMKLTMKNFENKGNKINNWSDVVEIPRLKYRVTGRGGLRV